MSTRTVPAADLVPGMYVDHRTRVARVAARGGTIYAQTTVRGSRSPSVRTYKVDEPVRIYDKGSQS